MRNRYDSRFASQIADFELVFRLSRSYQSTSHTFIIPDKKNPGVCRTTHRPSTGNADCCIAFGSSVALNYIGSQLPTRVNTSSIPVGKWNPQFSAM